jgi:hypothetical protein
VARESARVRWTWPVSVAHRMENSGKQGQVAKMVNPMKEAMSGKASID